MAHQDSTDTNIPIQAWFGLAKWFLMVFWDGLQGQIIENKRNLD